MPTSPGRNDPCPCGSGKKFKQCCLDAWAREDAARDRVRTLEGHVVNALMDYVRTTCGDTFVLAAWDEFFLWDDVPADIAGTPEFDSMFVPWLTLGFVADPEDENTDPSWPVRPLGMHWLDAEQPDVDDAEREYIRIACDSPMSVFVAEAVTAGRSADLKDILTGRRFHVLERGATKTLRRGDLTFARIVTMDGTSVMFGSSPWVIPAEWHTRIIDFREHVAPDRLMTRADLAEYDIEIRELYLDITASILDPDPPQLANTDGEPIEWATLTYEIDGTMSVDELVERLAPLAQGENGERRPTGAPSAADLLDDSIVGEDGRLTSATLSWVRDGSGRRDTILGTLTLSAGRLVAEVNSASRAAILQTHVATYLGPDAHLVQTDVKDIRQAMAERAAAREAGTLVDDTNAVAQDSPDVLALRDEVIREHLARWIDEKIPALDDRTPREAATTAIGRERVGAMLSSFEQGADKLSPGARRYVTALREKLGLA